LTWEDRGGGGKINRIPHPDLSSKRRGEKKRVKGIPLKTSSPLTGEDRGGGEKRINSNYSPVGKTSLT
jgi:hypothetical protein